MSSIFEIRHIGDDAVRRFKISIYNEDKDYVVLLINPRLEQDRMNYTLARVTLDKKKYFPTKVQLLDPNGLETIYRFEGVVVNDTDIKGKLRDLFKMKSDPYHPDLKGYDPVVSNVDPIDAKEKKDVANNVASPKNPASPSKSPIQPVGAQVPSTAVKRTVPGAKGTSTSPSQR